MRPIYCICTYVAHLSYVLILHGMCNLFVVPVDVYVNSFQWDNARYPSKQSIPNILDMINKITSDIEAEFKRKTTTYNNLKSQMQAIERRERWFVNTYIKYCHSLLLVSNKVGSGLNS